MLLFVIFLIYFTASENQEQPVDLRVAIVVLGVRVIILSRIKSIYIDDINCSKSTLEWFRAESLSDSNLDLNYLCFLFLNMNYVENFGCIYFKSCNKSFQFYIIYLESVLKICFNYFDEIQFFDLRILAIFRDSR